MTTTTQTPADRKPDRSAQAKDREEERRLEDEAFAADEEDAHKDLYMTFRIAEQDYGIEILDVNEIVGLQTITEVPDVPEYVKGMINLRGTVIPVVDVRRRFALEPRDYDSRTCVVVVTIEGATVGLVVDRVNEVGAFPAETISPPPNAGERKAVNDYISGMGKQGDHVTILLDTARLLKEKQA